MINSFREITKKAGDIILSYFEAQKKIVFKEDASPLTQADLASHSFLCGALEKIKKIPILSEEDIVPYDIRRDWSEFWLVDPLDGTKDFIGGYNEFCICIALIQNNTPILGVIYAPALNEFYFAEKGRGIKYFGRKKNFSNKKTFTVGISRFHHSNKTKEFMELNGYVDSVAIGSALKFAWMSTGEVDIYPRFEGSMEWDTAAGQLIVHESRGTVMDLVTKNTIEYNKPILKNNYFIAVGPRINIEEIRMPKMV